MLVIKECVERNDIMSTFTVMGQLRPKLQKDDYLELIQSLKKTDGYHLIALYNNDICIATAGYRIRRCLFNDGNPEMYIDDLVTDAAHRSKGYGKMLFDWLKKECKKSGYQGTILDSGLQQLEAHKFYLGEGMDKTALHFYRPLSPEPSNKTQDDLVPTSSKNN